MSEHDEKAILEEAEVNLTAYLDRCREEWRPQFVAEARNALHTQVRDEVEREFLDRIKGELKSAKGA